ncbi:helix-turn-helix transcriptional regulator [Burkholderia pseudomallei]|uniref:helix-turn-helix transcriptional regulator n=1 Tax=Burkholderia pseudomallei TaxID=28450 RepID=UPI0020B7D24E|nr:LuxR family transcriptional regulator [Burkholderia pseudomallei]
MTSSTADTSVGTRAYLQRFHALDPFVNIPSGVVTTVHEMVGERRWLESEIYRYFVKPYDILHILGADIHVDSENEGRLRICRPHNALPFSNPEKILIRLLLPHIKRALQLRVNNSITKYENVLYEETFINLHVGTIVLDEQGYVLNTNGVAESVLTDRNGLLVVDGRLVSDTASENRNLQLLISKALERPPPSTAHVALGMTLYRRGGRARLGLVVRHLHTDRWCGSKRHPTVVILVRDPDRRPQVSAEILKKMFGFTPTEATLVLHLTTGLTLLEAAQSMNIRHNTARSHLRAAFSKTGVTRQSDLIQTVLNCSIPLNPLAGP